MKATGIVRRIDDLGRVVIPKEIRHTLNIKEGDPIELWRDGDMVAFKKYEVMPAVEDKISAVVNMLDDEDVARVIPVEDRDVVKVVMNSILAKWKREAKNEG